MNPKERDELIDSLLDGGIAEADALRLEAEFIVDPAARRAYLDRVALAQALGEEAKSIQDTPAEPEARPGSFWLAWRPLTAAAAGLALGMLCTSVVFGYVMPRQARIEGKVLPLADGDFESGAQIPARGIPARAGAWSGDILRVVTAENGIQPKQGRRMLRILRSDNELSSGNARSYVGEVAQVLDLRRLHEDKPGEEQWVEVSAWFDAIPTLPGTQYEFNIKAAAFRGDIPDAPSLWEDQNASVSRSNRSVPADPDAGTWQRVAVPLVVPPEADMLVIECAVVCKGLESSQGAAEFPGHYVDQVEVRLGEPHRWTEVRTAN